MKWRPCACWVCGPSKSIQCWVPVSLSHILAPSPTIHSSNIMALGELNPRESRIRQVNNSSWYTSRWHYSDELWLPSRFPGRESRSGAGGKLLAVAMAQLLRSAACDQLRCVLSAETRGARARGAVSHVRGPPYTCGNQPCVEQTPRKMEAQP